MADCITEGHTAEFCRGQARRAKSGTGLALIERLVLRIRGKEDSWLEGHVGLQTGAQAAEECHILYISRSHLSSMAQPASFLPLATFYGTDFQLQEWQEMENAGRERNFSISQENALENSKQVGYEFYHC